MPVKPFFTKLTVKLTEHEEVQEAHGNGLSWQGYTLLQQGSHQAHPHGSRLQSEYIYICWHKVSKLSLCRPCIA